MSSVFFYGLFMDVELLHDMGFDPQLAETAKLPDYQLRIGNKATLVHVPGSMAYGIVMTLAEDEVEQLYAEPGVSAYRPEPVTLVMTADGSTRNACCYNMPAGDAGSEVNTEYAQKLAALATRLEFPGSYLDEILRFCG